MRYTILVSPIHRSVAPRPLRYLQVQRFFQERRPLFVLITGPPRSYKTTIAKQLASRLNITNVIQTDVLEPVLIG